MANPNLLSATTINGNTTVQAVTTTATAIATNSAASGKIFKVISLIISNVDGSASADITVDVFRSSTPYRIISSATIPQDTSLDLITKSLFLLEGDSLRLTASADSYLEAVCCFEEVS